jgi:hypothetical protein
LLYSKGVDHPRRRLQQTVTKSQRNGENLRSSAFFARYPFGVFQRLLSPTLHLETGGPACTMLEMKFLLFIDFPKKMAPGVFISCADDIEFFESQGTYQAAFCFLFII